MSVIVNFELSDRDVEHFVAMAREAHKAVAGREDAEQNVIAGARKLFDAARSAELPDFVAQRLNKLGELADMLTDSEWQLSGEDRERVLSALAYFANPDDLIPDRVPGIGFLDDAIMAELVCRELDAEISAYREFCAFRRTEEKRRADAGLPTNVSREDWLADQRAVLHSRMRERRRSASGEGGWRVRLW
ncbi:MAG TPA: YkvA family protein [Steroidobacteraceae bacterium]|nr:YkvA family protein [Steroidobacteraceae bacterium]